jgi:hypothetical protein
MPMITRFFLVLALTSCAAAFAADRVSIIQLIATPDLFHGKKVVVTGYLTIGFEDNVLYLGEEDARVGNFKNGLWVGYAKDLSSREDLAEYDDYYRRLKPYAKSYVSIEATFDAKNTGHLDCCSGELLAVTRIYPAPRTKKSVPRAPRK